MESTLSWVLTQFSAPFESAMNVPIKVVQINTLKRNERERKEMNKIERKKNRVYARIKWRRRYRQRNIKFWWCLDHWVQTTAQMYFSSTLTLFTQAKTTVPCESRNGLWYNWPKSKMHRADCIWQAAVNNFVRKCTADVAFRSISVRRDFTSSQVHATCNYFIHDKTMNVHLNMLNIARALWCDACSFYTHTYLHEPMVIGMQTTWISFVNFDDWQEIFVCYQNFILMV